MRGIARAASMVAVVVGLCGLSVADTKSENKKRADKLFDDGRRYLEAKEYALACTAFEQSQAADPALGTQLNIALCYEQWGKVASAYRAYLEAEKQAVAKKDKRAKGARKKVDELDRKVPRLKLELPPGASSSVVLLFDDKDLAVERLAEEMQIDPGPHSIEARLPRRPSKTTSFEIAIGERKTVTIELPPPELEKITDDDPNDDTALEKPVVPEPVVVTRRSGGRLYGGITLMVVGAAAMGAAGYFALDARSDYNDAVAQCPQFVCTQRSAYDATQDARKRANLMTIVGAGGGAVAVTGLVLVLTSKRQSKEYPTTVDVAPVLGPDHVGFAIGGRL